MKPCQIQGAEMATCHCQYHLQFGHTLSFQALLHANRSTVNFKKSTSKRKSAAFRDFLNNQKFSGHGAYPSSWYGISPYLSPFGACFLFKIPDHIDFPMKMYRSLPWMTYRSSLRQTSQIVGRLNDCMMKSCPPSRANFGHTLSLPPINIIRRCQLLATSIQ